MKNNALATIDREPGPASNLIALPTPRQGRIPENATTRQRFRILQFQNAGGTTSFRVQGMTRARDYIRENFADLKKAQCRQLELETEWLTRQPFTSTVRATNLTEVQLRIAEREFIRLDADGEMSLAVDYWIRHGRNAPAQAEALRLDDAADQFRTWLNDTPTLRARSKGNLRARVGIFAGSVPNVRLNAITPETIEGFLDKRNTSPVSKDNDRRALSRFFSWCIARPRRWLTANPAKEVKVEQGEKPAPAILTLEDCTRLLRAAQVHKKGRLAPYVSVSLFGGLRPQEAARLTWDRVNLTDAEIRIDGTTSKTGRARVVSISPTLKAWLEKYRQPFYPANFDKEFRTIKTAIGYGSSKQGLRRWTPDILRHTSISHQFRKSGSYGLTAEWAGNSERVIKAHYQGLVSSEDTAKFYAITPTTRKAKKGKGRGKSRGKK